MHFYRGKNLGENCCNPTFQDTFHGLCYVSRDKTNTRNAFFLIQFIFTNFGKRRPNKQLFLYKSWSVSQLDDCCGCVKKSLFLYAYAIINQKGKRNYKWDNCCAITTKIVTYLQLAKKSIPGFVLHKSYDKKNMHNKFSWGPKTIDDLIVANIFFLEDEVQNQVNKLLHIT